jgi:hypothetical protein
VRAATHVVETHCILYAWLNQILPIMDFRVSSAFLQLVAALTHTVKAVPDPAQ